jgi:NTP pyrophosphatase (non-canonical NTP hydrolase)
MNFQLDRIALVNASRLLKAQCHGASKAAGWWINPKTGMPTQHNPMCFAQKLMLTVSELAEAMEGDRKSLMDDKLPHRPMREVELADAVIRIFDLAGAYDLDIAGAIAEKMAFNQVRPDHQIAARIADGGKAY